MNFFMLHNAAQDFVETAAQVLPFYETGSSTVSHSANGG